MKSTKQAIENMEYVRRLLEQKQPEFAASLEIAASLVRQGWRNRWTMN
jgi:DNA-binding transcriptional regulator YiaG